MKERSHFALIRIKEVRNESLFTLKHHRKHVNIKCSISYFKANGTYDYHSDLKMLSGRTGRYI